jgi:hypothetical protein
MFRRGKKVWVTAALVLALLLTASPASAGPRSCRGGLVQGWEGLWERVVEWLGGARAAAGSAVHEKDSSSIDPNGGPKSSSDIDPNGQPGASPQSDSSGMIDPNG